MLVYLNKAGQNSFMVKENQNTWFWEEKWRMLRGMRKPFGAIVIFCILIGVGLKRVYLFVKISEYMSKIYTLHHM